MHDVNNSRLRERVFCTLLVALARAKGEPFYLSSCVLKPQRRRRERSDEYIYTIRRVHELNGFLSFHLE